MANTRVIYIELLREGTSCWRPVQSEHVDGERYRIIGEKPEDEVWPFARGDIVLVRMRRFQQGEPELVAYAKVD